MKRGGYGKPFRPPPDGWPATGRKVFFGPPYQHRRPGWNGLPRFVNNTQVTLQQNQVGRPVTRPAGNNNAVPFGSCESFPENGLPQAPWIGIGTDQYLPPVLGGSLTNTFQQQGTVDLGAACRQRGFKNVQAYRQWHGSFGFLDADGSDCPDTKCETLTTDAAGKNPGDAGYVPTWNRVYFRSYQSAAPQSKFITKSVALNLHRRFKEGNVPIDSSGNPTGPSVLTSDVELTISVSATLSVNVLSGLLTLQNPVASATEVDHVSGRSSTAAELAPKLQIILGDATSWPQCLTHSNAVNALFGSNLTESLGLFGLPDSNTIPGYGLEGFAYAASWPGDTFAGGVATTNVNNVTTTRANDQYTFSIHQEQYLNDVTGGGGQLYDSFNEDTFDYSGSFRLTGNNTSAAVIADAETLLSFWPMNDDSLYPWRTDGVWQIAPYVSREEAGGDVGLQGLTVYVDDLRSPVADANGFAPYTTPDNHPPPFWTYVAGQASAWTPTYAPMAWFDPSAYGFVWPAGRDQSNCAASDWKQFALTGLILGMPMPRAFTDANSYWYIAGFSAPSGAVFENFFDFRAVVQHACQWYDVGGGGPYVDFYDWGYGEWLYDAITRTGAQLPPRATQWTNNIRAMMLPPYAYMIQADQQVYDKNGSPGPSSDFHTGPGGLLAQKCCEVEELWPSYDFFRPAGADKFTLDQTRVCCVTNASGSGNGSTWTLTDTQGNTPADGLDVSGIWGGSSVGGFYSGCSYGGGVLTLGTKVFNVPSDWSLESGDEDTAVGPLRFSTAPAILGREPVTAVADAGGHQPFAAAWTPTYQFADPQTAFGMALSGHESVDIFDAGMGILGSNVTATRVDDNKFTLPTALAGAAFVLIHGAPHWYWDDNQRKGDFTYYSWLFDYRTNGENARLTGATDCSGNPITPPAPNNGYASFNQTQSVIKFTPCTPMVLAVTPNGETWPNAVVVPFPTTFSFDARYGVRWQFEFEQAMVDLLWQSPHHPCGMNPPDRWIMDDGSCKEDAANDNGGTDVFYAHFPFVESRISLPNNGGPNTPQNETAPALPTGITIGHDSPVTYPALPNAIYPPGMIGYDPASGNPSGAFTIWGYRISIEDNACFGSCRFDYKGQENLACVRSYSPSTSPASPSLSGLPGLS